MALIADTSLIRARNWLMIFLLCIIPGLIFLWDWNPEGEKEYRNELLNQRWFKKSEKIAQALYDSSEFEYWYKVAALRYRNLVNEFLISGKSVRTSLRKAYESYLPQGFPAGSMKTFFRTGKDADWNIDNHGEDGKKTGSDYLFKKLFDLMVKLHNEKISELDNKTWEQRLKKMFGHLVFSEIFHPDVRCTPFSAVIRSRPYTVIWDFIYAPYSRTIVGGYFLFFPRKYDEKNIPSDLIMKYWQQIADEEKTYPVLVPLNDSADKFLVHPMLNNPDLQRDLRSFCLENIKKVPSPVPELSDKMRLPAEKFGRAFKIGDYVARLCKLVPTSMHLGILLHKPDQQEKTFRRGIAEAYFLIVGIFWLMFLLKCLIFSEIPQVKLKFRVMAWFLAFAAFPAGLSIGAWSSFIQDFEDFRINLLQKNLRMSLQKIEADVSVVDSSFLAASRKITALPWFNEQILRLPNDPSKDQEFFNSLFNAYKKRKIDLSAAILITQGGWCFSRFAKGYDNRSGHALRDGLSSMFHKFLYEADSNLFNSLDKSFDKKFNDKRGPAFFHELNVYDNIYSLREAFNKVSDLTMAGKSYLQFYKQIDLNGKPFAVLLVYWDWKDEYVQKVKSSMDLEGLRFYKSFGLNPDIVAYKKESSEMVLLAKSGNIKGLSKFAEYPVKKIAEFSMPYSTLVMMPSGRIEGVRFVARLATTNVKLLVEREKAIIAFAIAVLFLIILTGVSGASLWITDPINKFIRNLRLLNQGNETEYVSSHRNDEIGVAGKSLKHMSDWILERERLLKFVSPKALQAVTEGDLSRVGDGLNQEVTILVSDIRSFTTLSEEYPAEEVFAMVNTHLDKMAEIITEYNGVIDRFVGDAIWAVFFDKHPQAGVNALKAAREMMRAHLQIQKKRERDNSFGYKIGIGIVKGRVLAGLIGDSSVRLDFSVVGEALNRAEYFEGLSKYTRESGIIFSRDLIECAEISGLEFISVSGEEEACEVKLDA
ncbi:MAG: hypothetical protein Kow0029_26950 [Candidatus Rifleibacteriota bacterium]